MPEDGDFDNADVPGIPVTDFTGSGAPGNRGVTTPSELEEALARMGDPEVRARFERLLKDLGHRA